MLTLLSLYPKSHHELPKEVVNIGCSSRSELAITLAESCPDDTFIEPGANSIMCVII